MQYNSHAQNLDCVSEIDNICNSTSNTYPINDKTRRFNAALDRFFHLAFEADAQWPFEDSNYSSAAIKTANLVASTNSYKITTIAGSNFANLLKVAAKDSAGTSRELTFVPFESITDFDTEYATTTTTTTPTEYTLLGDFLYLKDTPSYNLTNGLRLFVERNGVYMATTDTTKEPGVPSQFHWFLCRYAALPFLIAKSLPQVTGVSQQILTDEREIKEYFSSRNKHDAPPRMTPLYQNNR
jgi:hypothetical protein